MSFFRTIAASVGAVCFSSMVFSSVSLAESEIFTAQDVSQILDYLQDPQTTKLTEKKIACGESHRIAELNKTKTVTVTMQYKQENYSYQSETACKNAATPAVLEQICKDHLTELGEDGISGFRKNECMQELKLIKNSIVCDPNAPLNNKICDGQKLIATQHCVKEDKEPLACKVTESVAANPTASFSQCHHARVLEQDFYTLYANCTAQVTYTYSGSGLVGCTDCPR